MSYCFPPELRQIVGQELATGGYASEDELLLEAVRTLHQRKEDLREFQSQLQRRLDRLDRGETIDLADEAAYSMQKTICRWGILGTAEIARKNWQAIRNASNGVLTAVASRTQDRCRQFIQECQQHAPFEQEPRAYGNYEELLTDETVDAVYIPLPTGIRAAWAIRAAEAGKHILVEKPVGVTVQDVRDILAACRQNGVQFMDGVMFMHSRRMGRIREVLDDGKSIGAIKRIACQFADGEAAGDAFASNIRTNSSLEPHGCLGDLGWYCIRFILWAMDWKLPCRIVGHCLGEYHKSSGPSPIATDFSAELFYENGVSASFYSSFTAATQQWVNLDGTNGSLHASDFVLPWNGDEVAFEVSNPTFNVQGCNFVIQANGLRCATREHSHGAADAQETNMFRCFSELALSGCTDDSWGEMALKTQQVMDACIRSAASGVEETIV